MVDALDPKYFESDPPPMHYCSSYFHCYIRPSRGWKKYKCKICMKLLTIDNPKDVSSRLRQHVLTAKCREIAADYGVSYEEYLLQTRVYATWDHKFGTEENVKAKPQDLVKAEISDESFENEPHDSGSEHDDEILVGEHDDEILVGEHDDEILVDNSQTNDDQVDQPVLEPDEAISESLSDLVGFVNKKKSSGRRSSMLELQTLQGAYEELQGMFEASKTQLAEQTRKLQDAQKEQADFEEMLKQSKAKLEEQKTKIAYLNSEIERLKADYNPEMESVAEENSVLKDLQELGQRLDLWQPRLKRLRETANYRRN